MGQAALKVTEESQSPDELINKYKRYVHSVAGKLIASMHLPSDQLDEFVSSGYMGLVEAAQRFDPSSGIDFRNYAFLRIRGSIIDSIRANSELSGRAYKLSRAWAAAQSLEESYFFSTKTQSTKEDDQMLAEVFEFAASGALAFKFSMEDLEEEVADLTAEELSQEENLIERENSVGLKDLVLKLPIKEKIIIWSYYYEQKSFSQIAQENSDMTKSWISRLHARALTRLKELYLATGGDPREK